jgi:NTE family protein
VFSPVDIDGRRYVDGGIIRNLPVQECRALGARHVIAVSVSTPAGSLDDLDNAVKLLGQVVFLNEPKDSREQAKLSDRFIQIPMGKYTSGSFSSAAEIIDLGIREGRKLYPLFKHMADSLRQLDPAYTFRKDRLPATREYHVSDVVIEGLRGRDSMNFHRQIEGLSGNTIGHRELENNSRDAFANRTYKSIAYDIRPAADSGYQLVYKVKPESATMLKLGLNENSFTRFGVHLNLTTRNFLLPASRTMLSLNAGDNFRALFEHMQLLGYRNPWSNRLRLYVEHQDLPVFTDFKSTGAYKYKYFTVDDRFQRSSGRRSTVGFGFQWESVAAKPRIQNGIYYDGRNHFMQAYGFWQYNNLTRPQYPDKGTVAELKLGHVFGLDPDVKIYLNGQYLGELSPALSNYGNYLRFEGSFRNTARISDKWSWITNLHARINFSDRVSVFNNFVAGGMNTTMRNQIPFAGLREGEVVSESMASAQAGPRVKPFGNFHITLQGGLLYYDFIEKSTTNIKPASLMGGGLTFAYLTPIGPAELSFMASGKTDGVRIYFNFGFPFK